MERMKLQELERQREEQKRREKEEEERRKEEERYRGSKREKDGFMQNKEMYGKMIKIRFHVENTDKYSTFI